MSDNYFRLVPPDNIPEVVERLVREGLLVWGPPDPPDQSGGPEKVEIAANRTTHMDHNGAAVRGDDETVVVSMADDSQ